MRRYRIIQTCNDRDECTCDVSKATNLTQVGEVISIIKEFDSVEDLSETDAGTLTGLAYPGRDGAFIRNDGEECVLQVKVNDFWEDVKAFRLNAYGPFFDQILERELLVL